MKHLLKKLKQKELVELRGEYIRATNALIALENRHFLGEFPLVWDVSSDPCGIHWYKYPHGPIIQEYFSDEEEPIDSDYYD